MGYVIGAALAMNAMGLSMSLGAFLAGVLLADSEFRHELEADVEPFKGLLLGLFFIAVGMTAVLAISGGSNGTATVPSSAPSATGSGGSASPTTVATPAPATPGQ